MNPDERIIIIILSFIAGVILILGTITAIGIGIKYLIETFILNKKKPTTSTKDTKLPAPNPTPLEPPPIKKTPVEPPKKKPTPTQRKPIMNNQKTLSTSALSKRLNVPSRELFNRLQNAGFLTRNGDQWELTEQGKQAGGTYKTHPTHGTYAAWPETLQVPEAPKLITATVIGKELRMSASRVNHILMEMGWIESSTKGWKLTRLGKQAGGIQNKDFRSGVPYVNWNPSILEHPSFKNSFSETDNSFETTQQEILDFRKKYPAEHRTKDGHYVRSKSEMIIDNYFYHAGIIHAYEKKLPEKEDLYSDFYLPSQNGSTAVYIEFWGFENKPEYAARKKVKQGIYKKYDFNLIELTDKEVMNLDDYLPRLLLPFNLKCY